MVLVKEGNLHCLLTCYMLNGLLPCKITCDNRVKHYEIMQMCKMLHTHTYLYIYFLLCL